jgi:carboxyl-terminal processing protease
LLKTYPDFNAYNRNFNLSEADFKAFIDRAEKEEIEVTQEEIDRNKTFVVTQVKGLIARNLYEAGDYFEVIAPVDTEISKALEIIQNDTEYNNLLK